MEKQIIIKTESGAFLVNDHGLEFSQYNDGDFVFLIDIADLPEFSKWICEEYEKRNGVAS